MVQLVRGIKTALNANGRFKYKSPDISIDHLVIGGGIVGLAIARRLAQKFPRKSTILVERHGRAGEEISSRNSEVIHSGIYYPLNSMKTRLCLRGRRLLYEYCSERHIDVKRLGKLIVAKADQMPYVQSLHQKTSQHLSNLDPLTELISGDRARELEPDLGVDIVAALWCPQTGIVDSHAVMENFEHDILNAGGDMVYSTRVERIDSPRESGSPPGLVVQCRTGDNDTDTFLAATVINAAGLSAPVILNALLPPETQLSMYFARGSYASYTGPGVSRVSHLIYPCPPATKDTHAFHSLGTHLTLDLQGKVKFGPDLEWLHPPGVDEADERDFWTQHLVPDDSRLSEMHKAVTEYLPDVHLAGFTPDYVGVRPKIGPPGSGFHDFTFRVDARRMVSLLGIESPGLTSSLAIAEHVVDELL